MIGKAIRVAKAVSKVAAAPNKGKAAGDIVGAMAPLGTRTAVSKVTEVAVNKGIELAKDPVVRAKVAATGKQAAATGRRAATNVGNQAVNAAREIRRGAGAVARKAQSFREGHGR